MKVEKRGEKKREAPPKFIGRFKDGGLDFGTYTRMNIKQFIRENPNMPFELKPLLPESQNQRKFFEGAICPLVAFYQHGMDYRNYKDIEKVRDWLKIEFNGELVVIGGKSHRVAKSTKNNLNGGFLERVVGYIEDNYAPAPEVLDPESYKYWKDVIFPVGGPETYIDYLLEKKILKKYD